jgi:hypothetical protein
MYRPASKPAGLGDAPEDREPWPVRRSDTADDREQWPASNSVERDPLRDGPLQGGPLQGGPLQDEGEDGGEFDEPDGHGTAAAGEWLPPLFPQEWPPEPVREEWTPLAPPRNHPLETLPRRQPGAAAAQAVPGAKGSSRKSSATAWWIAIGVIIVALAVAAGVLIGLSLAQRHDAGNGAPAAGLGSSREAMRQVAENARP